MFWKNISLRHQHLQLTKNEMNIAFNINVTNNNNPDTELIEFQQLDIYDNPILNELVYNSLTEGITKLAEIIYYYYPTIYNISEDTVKEKNWYFYNKYKWEFLGPKI